MKQIKRWISGLLVLCMVLSMVPVTAHAETASGTCGENITWTLNDDGVLTISGTGPMTDYSSYSDAPWYGSCDSIISIIIEDGVSTIGDYAFIHCEKLTGIIIPDSITIVGDYAFEYCKRLSSIEIPESVVSIGDSAFHACDYLRNVNIPDNVASIGDYAFYSCYNLNSVTIPESVTFIGTAAFSNCEKLTSISVAENNPLYSSDETGTLFNKEHTTLIQAPGAIKGAYVIPEGVTSIGIGAFMHCDDMTSVTLPESVTSIGSSAFNRCSGLTSMTIPGNVTTIDDNAFYYCNSLTSISIPDSITSIGSGTFEQCDGLTSISIPASVTSIGSEAFAYCDGLINVTIGNGATVENSITTIGDSTFSYCPNLTSVTIGNSVTSISDYAFANCTSLASMTIPSSVAYIGREVFKGCTGLTSVIIGDDEATESGITSISECAFYDCESLTSVIIGKSVASIGDYAFQGCTGLTSLTMPDSVSSIGDFAFQGCIGLTNVTIGNSATLGSVTTSLGYAAFSNCSSLSSVTIGNNVISIGDNAFTGCTRLISMTIPSSVTSIGKDVFENCTSLTSLVVGDTEYTGSSNTSIGDYSFRNCTNLTSVTIGSNVTSIGISAFSNCSGLTNVTIPDSVITIGNDAFADCSGLTSMTIGNGVTSIGDDAFADCTSLINVAIGNSVTTIGNSAFNGCTGLTNATIPDSVTTIGDYSFSNCTSLTDVTIGNSVKSIGNNAFRGCVNMSSLVIGDSVVAIGEEAFRECTSLTNVTIPNSVTTIGEYAFFRCYDLGSVSIGNSVASIGYSTFGYCSSLTNVSIPDSVTSVGGHAFYECTNLTSVTIGDNVDSIGSGAFYYCENLKDVKFRGDAPTLGNYVFYCVTATAHYPADNATWTSDVMQDYGGTITWVPYEVEGGGGETESASKVRYFREWDAENQIAYFDNDLLLGSQVTEETDTSFLVDVDNLVGHYVLAETKARDDSDVAPDTLISIKLVETKTGTVSAADDETITIDGVVYVTPEDEFWPSALVDDVVLYHLHEGELVGIELLVTEEGRQTYWNTNNRQIIIDNTEYTLSELADAETIGFLGNSGYSDKSVRYLADKAHFVYNVVKYIPPEDVVHYETFKPMPEDQSILHGYVTDWNDAYQGFADAVHNALKEYSGTDEATKESIIAAEAARMKKADQEDNAGYITGDLHGYEDLAYKALATFIYDYSTETAELSSIDVMDVMAGAALVNNISKSIRGESKEYRYGKVTISITAISAMGSEFGSLTCTAPEGTYTVPVCSTLEECEESISAYLLELRDLATNSAYNIASSIYTDILGKPLYSLTSEYMNKQAAKIERKLAVNLSEKLNLAGVGELFSTLDECYTYYTWMCKPINLGDLDDLQNIVNKTINLKFEDTTIKNAVVNKALEKLRNAARDLDNAAQLYLDGTLVEKENSFWNFLFNCPVNIAVFNSNGEQIGYVSDDDIWYTNVLKITELGGAKEITALTDDLLSFTITSTDYGTMSCSFEEYGDDFEPIGRLNYYDIALEPDMTFNVTMIDDLVGNADTLAITTNVGAILADEYVSVDQDATVFVTANPFADNGQEGGSVFGIGTFVRGDAVVLVAEPHDNYKFVGWYCDETLVSVDSTYEFTAKENISLTARFFNDDYLYVDIDVEQGGNVIGSGRYSDGETASIFAYPDENYTFSGWFIDDALISTDLEYSFVVTEDITITAHFSMLEHSFSDDWSYDATKHWHECVDGDGVRSNEAEHVPGDTATETSPQVCTVCGYEIMPATGHVTHITTLVPAIEATCEHTGNIAYYTCSGCNLWFEDAEATKVIEDHHSVITPLVDHSYESVVTAPTCTEQGYTTHTCSVCGDSYVDTYIDATGHSFGEWTEIKAATCTEKGEETRTCACGEVETRETAALGHTADEAAKENEVAASCGADGSYDSVVYCATCGDELSRETVTVPATGDHNYAIEQERMEATCTEDGYVIKACGCGATEKTVLPATGHGYESVVTAPTCTEQGYTTHTCSVCGDSYVDSYVEATGHSFGEWTESRAATCTEKGEESRSCACGETETREINALGHTYQDGICNRCGENDPDYELPTEPSEPDEPGRPCWDSFWDWIFGGWWDDEKCDHEYTSVITAPTCDQKGYTTHTCDKCGDSYKDSYTNALGHQFENGVCTECGKNEKPGGPSCGSIWDWIFGWWN